MSRIVYSEKGEMMDNWPFKYFNGVQTPESLVLETDKGEHATTPIDFNDFEEALL
jgi:hypothetical protein